MIVLHLEEMYNNIYIPRNQNNIWKIDPVVIKTWPAN